MTAPITPGSQPKRVNSNTIKKELNPLSATANGGKRTHTIILQIGIII
jgi:hypothetical protein